MLCLSNNGNNLHLKHVQKGWKNQAEIDLVKYYVVQYEIVRGQYNYSKL